MHDMYIYNNKSMHVIARTRIARKRARTHTHTRLVYKKGCASGRGNTGSMGRKEAGEGQQGGRVGWGRGRS